MEHEKCFVYADAVMSALLIVSAFLLFFDIPQGKTLTLVCGGMMFFLTILDTAYFIQNGMFAKDKKRAEHLGVVIPTGAMSLLMILRFV